MNTKELRERIFISWKGYGTYKVQITYNNKFYTCISHNSLAYDRLRDDSVSDRVSKYGYTYKQALTHFWHACKNENNL